MKKAGLIVLLLVLATAGGLALQYYLSIPREEGVGHLKTVSSVPYLYGYDILNFFWALDKEPESLSGMPENAAGRKTFFSISFRNRNLICCLFVTPDHDYTIYADLNGDDSLSDEKPIPSRKEYYGREDRLFVFGPLSLTDNSTVPFYLFFTNFTGGIHIAPTTIAKGKIRINDSVHKFLLADLDFDGEYNDRFTPDCFITGTSWNMGVCDRLLFDLDCDKKFVNCYYMQMENQPLPKLICVDKRFYNVQIKNQELLVSPADPESGILKLNTDQSSMELYSDTYPCFIGAANTKDLPAAHYSIVHAQNKFKDSNGDIWSYRTKSRSGLAGSFEISANTQTIFEFPTSFLLQTDVAGKEGELLIDIKLTDKNEIAYVPLFRRNDQSTSSPLSISICTRNRPRKSSGTRHEYRHTPPHPYSIVSE